MSEFFLPSITHVIPMTTIRRERVLPVPGAVTVRVNEKVQASDVIAEAEVAQRFYYLDVVRGLGLPLPQVGRYITCQRGDRVEEGQILAGPVGVTRRTLRAPADGRIGSIANGRILLEARGELLELRAGFPGVVTASDGVRSVILETSGALIQAVWGNGKQDFGVMRVVGNSPASRLQTDQLDINLRGAVLVAGVCNHAAPLHQATELSVRGVILGGMASDLIRLARRLPFPIILLEGFGDRPINTAAFNLLLNNVGREVAVIGEMSREFKAHRPEAIIPLPANRAVALPDEVVALKQGVRVRILQNPHRGEVGIVQEILPIAVKYASGIRARSAAIEVEGIGRIRAPLENLEVLQ
jgi:hypothetical protein